MTTQRIINKGIFLLFATTFFLQGCGNPDSGSGGAGGQLVNNEEIFLEAESEASGLSRVSTLEEDKSARKRFVRVNFPALLKASENFGGRLRLNFFSDESVDIVLEEVQRVSAKNVVIIGRIVNDPDSAATLVVNNDVVLANIRRGETTESFEVKYVENGLHVIHKPVEIEGLGACGADEIAAESDAQLPETNLVEEVAESLNEETASPMAAPVIDILGAYTPKARSYQGGTSAIVALIQMGIADTNRAMADSGVATRVRLVGTMEVGSNESGDWQSDLSRLKGTTDGKWDTVHAERRRLGADQVSLVGWYSGSSTAGIGYVNSTYSNAFAITKASMFRQYTFSHELGHNIGLNHSDGYVSSAGRFRTIIAYGSYPRIRRYSNPSLKYNGYITGTSYKNEAKILNANSGRVASILSPMMTEQDELPIMAADEAQMDEEHQH